jgi:hypothetical protein
MHRADALSTPVARTGKTNRRAFYPRTRRCLCRLWKRQYSLAKAFLNHPPPAAGQGRIV